MRLFYITILSCAIVAQAEKPKGKRTTVDTHQGFSPQYSQAQYQQAAREQPEYLTQSLQQYYQQPEATQAQAVAYQPSPKFAAASAAQSPKYTYTQQPKQQVHYSSAADVSSFSYSSPVVSYNNLGLLQQLAGKGASSQDVPVSYTPSAQPSKQQYQPQPKLQYVSAPKVQYTSAPVQYSAPAKPQYKTQPAAVAVNAYSASNAAPNYEEIYQQIAQKASYAAPEQQPQAYSPQQKFVYTQADPRLVYQLAKGQQPGQEEAYSAAPSQQYSFQLPQEVENQHQQHQQLVYAQPAQAQQHQYYTVGAQSAQSAQAKGNVQYA
ncbi:unnamed protein product [Phyllotreta striolata]|uniref:Uncharacterized protein n=1 Tax=Phyllotreta striolata TaxID=444603 RepID=A0A9N9XMF2_PHYSR|nr:unnamed protein product [Phyllotreta striolata]